MHGRMQILLGRLFLSIISSLRAMIFRREVLSGTLNIWLVCQFSIGNQASDRESARKDTGSRFARSDVLVQKKNLIY